MRCQTIADGCSRGFRMIKQNWHDILGQAFRVSFSVSRYGNRTGNRKYISRAGFVGCRITEVHSRVLADSNK